MKKKYLNILLVPLTIIIYSGLFLKHFGKKELIVEELAYNTTFSNQASNFKIQRNDFDITKLENDPFGINKKRIRKPSETLKTEKANFSSPKKIEQKKPWPKITYYGFVKNSLSKKRLVLVKINSKLYRKREEEDIDDIKIIKAYNDSIVLNMDNENKTINKINE